MQPTADAPTIPWDDVELFLALCRSRTLGDAAERLNVDASTVSRRLSSLEAALDTALFERGRGGILATEAAERLRLVAEEIEHGMARFAGTLAAFERDVSGPVRIACPRDAAELMIAPLLPSLLQRHPKLRVELAAGERVVDMARREADLALRTVRPQVGDLIVTRLFTLNWKVAAAPRVAKKAGCVQSFADVPWVGCTQSMATTTPGRWLAKHVGDLEPLLRSDSLTVQLAAAKAGLGVALVPEGSIAPYGLVPLRLSPSLQDAAGAWPQDDLFLVVHRALRTVPRVRAVWDFLTEELSEGVAGRER